MISNNPLTRFQKILIGFFLLTALGIRIHAALHDHTPPDQGDSWGYNQIATSLASGKGFGFVSTGQPTAWCAPLYPLFLSAVYRIVGHDYLVIKILQAILSALTVLVIVLWTRLLFGGLSACIAAFIATVYPAFYAYYFGCPSISTETLYVLFFTIALCTFFYYWRRSSWSLAVISGLFWGLSNLTRPMSAMFLLLLPFLLILLRYPVRQVLRYCGTVWFVVGLVIAPWIVRNYLVFHAFVPLSTGTYSGFYCAYHPNDQDGLGGDCFHESFLPEEARLRSLGMNEGQRANYFVRKGFEFIPIYPRHALRLFLRRILLYMDPTTTLYQGGRKRIVAWGYLFVLAGAAAAFFLSLRRKVYRREILSLCLIFGYFILFHAFFGASERYRFPTEPILILLASFALSRLPFFRKENLGGANK